MPLRAATADERAAFSAGDRLFSHPFTVGEGLGPLYIRASCESCHAEAGRGPGTVQKLALVGPDGFTPFAPDALAFGHTVRPYTTARDALPVVASDGGLPEGALLLVTTRQAPALLGRGYLEAIADAEIEAQERTQASRDDGIHGRINRVTYRSQPNPDPRFGRHAPGETGLIGRFGLKARQPTLDDFTADALQGDMGLTSPLRPAELLNPAGIADDLVRGADLDAATVNSIALYMRLLEIPARDANADTARARALFETARCAVCHVPSLRTRSDYPIRELAGIAAPVFTDLLLHDLGPAHADGLGDESAGSTEWRTAPLIGLRFMRRYLHDGRAGSIEEAILMHGGPGSQANDAVQRFEALAPSDREILLAFVRSL